MQSALKYFFVMLLIFFQSNHEPAHAAKPILPSIDKIHEDKSEPTKNK